jgi:hypothetical protein
MYAGRNDQPLLGSRGWSVKQIRRFTGAAVANFPKRDVSPLGAGESGHRLNGKGLLIAACKCLGLHSNYMLNRGYAYTTIISSQHHGQNLLFHLASLYPHSTPQAWQEKLNNGEVTLDGATATGGEWVTARQTLVWNRPPWVEPDSPQHFEVLFEDLHFAGHQQTRWVAYPAGRLHGEQPPAPGAKANRKRKPCPPVGPSYHRHRPLRQDTAGGL